MNSVHNERIKLLANAMNTIACAFFVTAFVVPTIAGQIADAPKAFVTISWISLSVGLHIGAHFVLGNLRP